VGNTLGSSRSPACLSVHPHIRGEYWVPSGEFAGCGGSSPHPWGIHRRGAARQGNPSVHPHIRGEYDGTPRLPHGLKRFIPTSVGNTVPSSPPTPPWPVHPHIRGEYMDLASKKRGLAGSSPHPWGIPVKGCLECLCLRFIPTSVGNTDDRSLMGTSSSVHPHIRGEYKYTSEFSDSVDGSSPHPWGILYMIV